MTEDCQFGRLSGEGRIKIRDLQLQSPQPCPPDYHRSNCHGGIGSITALSSSIISYFWNYQAEWFIVQVAFYEIQTLINLSKNYLLSW